MNKPSEDLKEGYTVYRFIKDTPLSKWEFSFLQELLGRGQSRSTTVLEPNQKLIDYEFLRVEEVHVSSSPGPKQSLYFLHLTPKGAQRVYAALLGELNPTIE